MRVAPEAEMNDGMFDVVVVRKVPRLCIPFLLPLFMLGWHTKLGLARVMRAKRVSLARKGHDAERGRQTRDSRPRGL